MNDGKKFRGSDMLLTTRVRTHCASTVLDSQRSSDCRLTLFFNVFFIKILIYQTR